MQQHVAGDQPHPAGSGEEGSEGNRDLGLVPALQDHAAAYHGTDQPELALQRHLPEMRDDEVFVRVRLDVTEVQKTRLFADEIGFLMGPRGNGYQIVKISEDFTLP